MLRRRRHQTARLRNMGVLRQGALPRRPPDARGDTVDHGRPARHWRALGIEIALLLHELLSVRLCDRRMNRKPASGSI